MKNVIVYTIDKQGLKEDSWKHSLSFENVKPYINLQIENSLRIGWKKEDIKIVTNFDYEFMGISCINKEEIFKEFLGSCMAKYLGVKYILETYNDSVYLKDHDCYEIEKFDYDYVLGSFDFVCCGKLEKRKISDQSSFFSVNMIPYIDSFYDKYKNTPKNIGFMFKFGKHIIKNCKNINIVKNYLFPYRFNMCGNWKKTLRTIIEYPKVLHQKLNNYDVVEFLESTSYGKELLDLYKKYSANLTNTTDSKISLTNEEFEILKNIILKNNVNSVLEFGPGKSTLFFTSLNCIVDSYEYNEKYINYYKLKGIHSSIFYNIENLGIKNDKIYDLSLVDSPKGTKSLSRINTLSYAIKKSKIIVLHDTKRRGEKESIQKILNENNNIISKFFNTKKGITIFYDKNSDILI